MEHAYDGPGLYIANKTWHGKRAGRDNYSLDILAST